MAATHNTEGSLSELDHDHDADNYGCHSSTCHHTSSPPWCNTKRETEKIKICKYIRSTPSGVPLSKLVKDVFDDQTRPGDADYQLTRRFLDRYPEFFKTDRRAGTVWVEPRIMCLRALNLRPSYASDKTAGRRRHATGDAGKTGKTSDGDSSSQYAKERAQSYVDSHLQINADSVRRSLYDQFLIDKAGTEDKWQWFERIRGAGDKHLAIPYRTRFNSGKRAGDVHDRFKDALQIASERYQTATVLTLTTDPKQHSSLFDALDSLSSSKQRLMSWLSTEYQLGHRPDNLTVLEFTESGLPHYHLVLFGVPESSLPERRLSDKWFDYGQGFVVNSQSANNARNGDWLLYNDDSGKVKLNQYLGKVISKLQSVANTEAAELRDQLDGSDLSFWKQSLYWATERQHVTCSLSLKPTDNTDENSLPYITEWRFIGVAAYSDVPAHIRQSTVFVTSTHPPP